VADAALDVTEFGELTLRREQRSALTLWVPNTDEGSVSKIDVVAASEIARYRTRGKNPIRVAVDHRGDVWVLDGSLAGRAYVTKIAGAIERCRDRNGDGVRTAQRADDVRPLGQDECVLLELPLGAAGDDARALALDGALGPDKLRAGNVWVGLAGAERLLVLDGASGAQLRSVQLPDFHAYAAAFDVWGVLWLIARDGWLARVDPARVDQDQEASMRAVPFACYALEGLSIDAQGRLLLTGFGCENVLAYDPRRDAWRKAQVSQLLSPRGVIALADASWVAYTSGQIGRVARDPLIVETALPLAQGGLTPYETIAMAADTRGQVWAISTQGGPDGRGLATCFDPQNAQVTAQVPVGTGPRGTGDLSGFALSTEFVREGQATHVFLGCDRDGRGSTASSANIATRWRNVHVASVLGAGASIELALRHAATEDALSSHAFTVLGSLPGDASPFALDLPDGGAVEVRLTLRSPAAIGAPRVARVGLEWNCPGPD
jgi:streptogramin lyase